MNPNDPMFGRSTVQKFTDAYTPKAYSDRAVQMKGEGFTAVKFDLDIPTPYSTNLGQKSGALNNREIGYLADLVRAVRNGVGDETDIMFDLHWKYDLGSSIRLLKAMEPFGVMWIEDPLPPDDLSLLGKLTKTYDDAHRKRRERLHAIRHGQIAGNRNPHSHSRFHQGRRAYRNENECLARCHARSSGISAQLEQPHWNGRAGTSGCIHSQLWGSGISRTGCTDLAQACQRGRKKSSKTVSSR